MITHLANVMSLIEGLSHRTYGECYYCRDGQRVLLVPHRIAYIEDGEMGVDTEMVCQRCKGWLER